MSSEMIVEIALDKWEEILAKLRECEELRTANKFLNEEIKKYNKEFTDEKR